MKKRLIFGLALIFIFALSACTGKPNPEISPERLAVLLKVDKLFIESATESLKTTQNVVDSINLYKEHQLKATALDNIERIIKIQNGYIDLVQGIDAPELKNYKEYLLGFLQTQKQFAEKCYECIDIGQIDGIRQALDSYTDSEYKNEGLPKVRLEDFAAVGVVPDNLTKE